MTASPVPVAFDQAVAALIPNLRAFARALGSATDRADDLVQETLVKAWRNREKFAEGTNLKAWLFTILRNTHISEHRRSGWQVDDPQGDIVASVGVPGGQQSHMDLLDFRIALDALPSDQKEALLLVGAEGFSYEEAADMCGCAVGTIKSRVNRARAKLSERMGIADVEDLADTPNLSVGSNHANDHTS